MKNARLPLVVIILCIALGCRKDLHKNTSNHLNQYTQTGSKEDLNSINKNGIIASGWQGTNDWVQVNLPTHTVYYTNLKTAVADYTSQEVVRVFKNSPQSLPFEEIKNEHKYYWYYTATKGKVMIAVDVYGSTIKPNATDQFKTFVFTPVAITSFQPKEKVKIELSKLPYEKIDAVLTE